MPRARVWVAGAAAILAGAVLARGAAPSLTGSWTGASRGKFLPFHPDVKGGGVGASFSADLSQAGPNLTGTLTNGEDPPQPVAGRAGNGSFWAATGGDFPVFLVVGHTDRTGKRLKGGVFRLDLAGATDSKFKAAK